MIPIENPKSHVATSCVEAGVDISFRSAFRESQGLVNLLQIACLCEAARRQAGRASRSGEYQDTEVWDFRHDESGGLSLHPALTRPSATVSHRMGEGRARGVLAEIFKEFAKQQRQPLPGDALKPDYEVPTWDDIKDKPVRERKPTKWSEAGRYTNCAL